MQFKIIPGFPAYRISRSGILQTRWIPGRRPRGSSLYYDFWKAMKSQPRRDGYRYVCLHNRHTKVFFAIHQLVMRAWVGLVPPGKEVCHNNGRKPDCRKTNLRYDTRKNNLADMERHGTKMQGEKNPQARMTTEEVIQIRKLAEQGVSQRQIAVIFRRGFKNISKIVRYQRWKHI